MNNKEKNSTMNGVWTSRSNAFYYTGLSSYQLDKLLQKCKRKGEGKKKQWFIPAQSLTEQSKQDLILTEENDDQFLDQLAGSVDFNEDEDPQLSELNKQLKKARKQKIQKQTAFLQQRLQRRKVELFNEWKEQFFECFADSFGKFKNELINLHLNEEQIATLNESLDSCLNNMQLNLDNLWNEFNKGDEQDEQD